MFEWRGEWNMNKTFRSYTIVWAVLLAMFNVVAFVTPNEMAGMTKFGGAFWAGYIFISLAFVGQLAVAYYAFRAQENAQKFFYRVPLITISWTGLILTLVFGSACMIIPDMPNWLGVIICFVILGFNAMSLVKADAAAELVEKADEKIKNQTFFIRSLTVDAESLLARAKSEVAKAECKKVYEAVRYSDPMSHSALAYIESEIAVKFTKLTEAVGEGDDQTITALAEEVVILAEDRNKKCKLMK